MRTLEEMKIDLGKIEENLDTIAKIASLARPYTPYDLATWNALIPTTAGRIKELNENLNEAITSIGSYTKQVALNVRLRKCRTDEAQNELNRASQISSVIFCFAKTLESQSTRFDAYQEQALKHL